MMLAHRHNVLGARLDKEIHPGCRIPILPLEQGDEILVAEFSGCPQVSQ